MTTVYLIRHAEADGNLYRRVHGQFDGLVSARGLQQIKRLKERFLKTSLDAVYSSDLYRARLTATALTEPKGPSLKTDKDLREINLGDWEDCTWGEVERCDYTRFLCFNDTPWNFSAPGGESMQQVFHRIHSALCNIVKQHENQTIAVVTHGIALRTLFCFWSGKPMDHLLDIPHSDNTAVTKVQFHSDGREEMIYCGDNSHLDATTSTLVQHPWKLNRDTREKMGKNLWFQSVSLPEEQDQFLACREDAWLLIHGSMADFPKQDFLDSAIRCRMNFEKGLQFAMLGTTLAGVLQTDAAFPDGKSLQLPFVYLTEPMRGIGVGVQLIGEAQSIARRLQKSQLRLRCSPTNTHARHFYEKLGFSITGQEDAPGGPFLIMCKSILPLPLSTDDVKGDM